MKNAIHNLKERTIKNLTWSFGTRFFQQITQFAITAILARLLSPDIFGLLGMVTVFTGFATIFGELGISAALIQKEECSDKHYSTAFFLNVGSGILLSIFFILLSPLIANFYNKPQLKLIVTVLSVNFVITSFSIVQKAIYQKMMNFKILTLAESLSVVASGIVGITLALRGYGVWSLVFQMITLTFVTTLLLWIFSPLRFKFAFSKQALKDIINFSMNVTGFNLINYFARNVDYLLIGKFLGTEALGYYTLAYKLMLYPLQNISSVISRVMFPAFSYIQHDLEKVRKNYLKMIKAISLVTFPAMLGLIAICPEFVYVIFGPKWENSIILIRILSICGMFQSIGTTVGVIILSLGKSELQLKLQILGTFIVTIVILLGMRWGVTGVALFYTIQSIIWVHFTFFITCKIINLDYIVFLHNLKYQYIYSIIMFGAMLIFKDIFVLSDIYMLISLIMIGILVYFPLLFSNKGIMQIFNA